MIWFALALLVAGAVLGSRGLRGLARTVRGPWRPGAGVFAALAAFAALALAARAEWIPAAVLLVLSAALVFAARARPRARGAPTKSVLSRREAESLLGLGPDPSAGEVEEAYRRLMRRAHPDLGGSAGLAAQLNAARAVLLRGSV